MTSPTPLHTTIPSTTATIPRTHPRRESRFTEGSEVTRPDMLSHPSSSNTTLLITILSQMDEHESARRKRERGASNSSVESFVSSTGIASVGNSPKEGRRSVTFGRRSLDGREDFRDARDGVDGLGVGLASKVKGRLRALTGERRKDVKPYPGT
ncbi:hypothetical protein EG329_010407 [Mollisiaceae sp. DMI_Dod_QoI]|nr:hypothetical protein EG329_010407 [Helotiales sp. DMI_Dod_QoI]